jgi:Domain of unknown function (DUF6430)
MSSTPKKQLEYFLRRETLVKLANNFLIVFGILWLFTESTAFFFSEYLSNYRSPLFLVIFVTSLISSLVLSFPRLQYSRIFPRLNLEIDVKVGDVLKETENGACNIVFGSNDTFITKVEKRAGKQSIRSQLANNFYQGKSHLFDKAIVDSFREKRLVDEIRGTYKVPVGSVGVVKTGNIKTFCLVNTEKVVGKTTNISKENLWLALCNLWEAVKNQGDNHPVIVPVLGAGLSRASASRVSLIQLILMSFAVSNREFRITKKLTIIIHEQDYSPSEMSEVIAFIDALDL